MMEFLIVIGLWYLTGIVAGSIAVVYLNNEEYVLVKDIGIILVMGLGGPIILAFVLHDLIDLSGFWDKKLFRTRK